MPGVDKSLLAKARGVVSGRADNINGMLRRLIAEGQKVDSMTADVEKAQMAQLAGNVSDLQDMQHDLATMTNGGEDEAPLSDGANGSDDTAEGEPEPKAPEPPATSTAPSPAPKVVVADRSAALQALLDAKPNPDAKAWQSPHAAPREG
jgi:hypothetical protein